MAERKLIATITKTRNGKTTTKRLGESTWFLGLKNLARKKKTKVGDKITVYDGDTMKVIKKGEVVGKPSRMKGQRTFKTIEFEH